MHKIANIFSWGPIFGIMMLTALTPIAAAQSPTLGSVGWEERLWDGAIRPPGPMLGSPAWVREQQLPPGLPHGRRCPEGEKIRANRAIPSNWSDCEVVRWWKREQALTKKLQVQGRAQAARTAAELEQTRYMIAVRPIAGPPAIVCDAAAHWSLAISAWGDYQKAKNIRQIYGDNAKLIYGDLPTRADYKSVGCAEIPVGTVVKFIPGSIAGFQKVEWNGALYVTLGFGFEPTRAPEHAPEQSNEDGALVPGGVLAPAQSR